MIRPGWRTWFAWSTHALPAYEQAFPEETNAEARAKAIEEVKKIIYGAGLHFAWLGSVTMGKAKASESV